MNMVWLTILTLIAGSTGGPVASRDHGPVCRAAIPRIASPDRAPARSHKLVRRVHGLPCLPPWSSPLLEEFDTPEVDETWIVDLDVVTTIPISWFNWARPGSSSRDLAISHALLSTILDIPLRC